MIILFILFAVFAILFLFCSHYFVYYSLVHFFSITNLSIKYILGALLIILPLSFITSSLLAHWKENIFTRAFYFISSLWLGVALYILLAIIAVWILFGLAKLTGINLNFGIICALLLIISGVISGYGIWNAYHPRLKEITVHIPNLPDSWKNKTAVQITDIHIGHILGKKFLKQVADQINGVNPDIVFITGDLLDGMDGNLDLSLEPLKSIDPPLGSYFVSGNHETYFGVDRAYALIKNAGVKILNDEEKNIDGMQIIGVSYPERGFTKDIAGTIKKIPGFDANQPSILLYHDPVQIAANKNLGINLQLSGHTHAGQIWPINYITELIYKKYYTGLHVENNYTIYTSTGTGVWGPTMRFGNSPEIVVIKFN